MTRTTATIGGLLLGIASACQPADRDSVAETGVPTGGGTGAGSGGTDGGGGGDGDGDGDGDGSGDGDGDGDGGGTESSGEDSGTGGSIRLDVGEGGSDGGGESGADDVDVTCANIAQSTSNLGCEFWAVDLPNWDTALQGVQAPTTHTFAVAVANSAIDADATVSVYLADGTVALETTTVGPDQLHIFELPDHTVSSRENTYDVPAFRIESDVPVTAYQFQPLDNTVEVFSNDASILFPTHVLGRDYGAITSDTYDTSLLGTPTPAYVSIVALEDDTIVDVFPTDAVAPGAIQGVNLARGRVMTVLSQPGNGYNLSGTRVLSDKPVAVFSGNACTTEPAPPGPSTCCCDHLEQQMTPLTAWGNAYVAVPPPRPSMANTSISGYRIVGVFDGTDLLYDPAPPPGAPASIDAGSVVRFETDQPFTVTSADPSKSFAVAQVLMSNSELNGGGGFGLGDPAMIVPPAVAQYQAEYIFLTPDAYADDFVTVIRPAGSTTQLDGTPVDPGQFAPVGDAEGVAYEYALLPLAAGVHRVIGSEPFGILSIGYDQAVSYGYAGGSGVDRISIPPVPPG